MLSCRETTRLLSDAMEHRLPLWQRVGLRIHLLLCRLCRRYARQLRLLDRLAREYARTAGRDASPAFGSLSPEARERLRHLLRDRR